MPSADRVLVPSRAGPAGPATGPTSATRSHPALPVARAAGNRAFSRLLARQAVPADELVCLPEEPVSLPEEPICLPDEDVVTTVEEDEQEHVPATVSSGSVASALASVKVEQRTVRTTSLKPWEVFEHAPRNNKTKKSLWRAYVAAVRAEKKARAALAKAEKAQAGGGDDLAAAKRAKLDKAVTAARANAERAAKKVALARAAVKDFVKKKVPGWSPDPQLNRLETEVKTRKRALRSARGAARAQAKTALEDAQRRYAERVAALRKEIDDDPMLEGPIDRKLYTITVGDTVVRLHDHVDAYATVNAQGLEGSARRTGAKGPSVDELIDADPKISASTKKILKLVSSFEGKFSSVNTWDIADVTWGFIQWTTGRSGRGSLIETLQAAKKLAPKVFDERLRRYGIDVGTDAQGIVLTLADGRTLTGLQAAKHIQTDPVLVAILSAAGEDPDIKVVQLRHANDKVGKEVLRSKIKVGGRSIALGELLTSELGVGAAFNRAVHAGAGAVRTLLQAAVGKHVTKEKIDPKSDLASWRAGAETACIKALENVEPDRTRKMAKVLSDTPGSYR